MANKKIMMSLTTSAAIAATIFAAEEAHAATYTVNSGDSLWKIAQKYNTTVPQLKSINNLSSDLIFINQKIETSKSNHTKSSNKSNTTNTSTYVVKSGDSLSKIAAAHSISLSNLMSWNDLDTTLIFPGNKLVVSKGSGSSSSSSSGSSNSNSSSSSNSSTYTVQSGDTLSHIAVNNGVSVSNLKQWNNLSSDLIRVGQKLSIKGGSSSDSGSSSSASSSSNSGSSSSSSSKQTTYVVKSGDSLSKIGAQHGVSVSSLKSWNNLRSDLIHIGQKLSINGKSSTGGSSSSGSSSSDAKNTSDTSYNVSTLVNEAKKHQGVPYVWGGQSPSGFDCSGFIHYIYNKAGLSAGRTNTGGYYNRSRMINNPQVGDLVFFEGTYKRGISHMGVYLGGGDFIHAGTSTGVTISNVNGPYWKDHFHSYKRFY